MMLGVAGVQELRGVGFLFSSTSLLSDEEISLSEFNRDLFLSHREIWFSGQYFKHHKLSYSSRQLPLGQRKILF